MIIAIIILTICVVIDISWMALKHHYDKQLERELNHQETLFTSYPEKDISAY